MRATFARVLTSTDKRTFLGVQALRGVAAGMVVIHHATQFWISKVQGNPLNDGWPNGIAGVDIFFVISGFVMTLSCMGSKPPSASKFLWRRMVRILPLYWLFTFLTVLKILVSNHAAGAKPIVFSLSRLFTSILLLPIYQPAGKISFIVPVGWTLSFEMFFYLLISVAIFYKIASIKLLAPALIFFAFVGLFRTPAWPSIASLLSPLLLEFLAGVIIASFLKRLEHIPKPIISMIGLTALTVLLVAPQQDGLSGFGVRALSAALLVSSTALLELELRSYLSKLALMIGDASYSLYLSHYLILSLTILFWPKTHTTLYSKINYTVLSLAVSIAISLLLYRFLEAPMMRAFGSKNRTASPQIVQQEERAHAKR